MMRTKDLLLVLAICFGVVFFKHLVIEPSRAQSTPLAGQYAGWELVAVGDRAFLYNTTTGVVFRWTNVGCTDTTRSCFKSVPVELDVASPQVALDPFGNPLIR